MTHIGEHASGRRFDRDQSRVGNLISIEERLGLCLKSRVDCQRGAQSVVELHDPPTASKLHLHRIETGKGGTGYRMRGRALRARGSRKRQDGQRT